ncbi:MAG TPA: cytochrome P450 [Opitutaceae bacterium]|jgi:cytochrome P450|nr:cytochrome P450 [Opitutaceae bacterium]
MRTSGPIEPADLSALSAPPELRLPRVLQEFRFNQRQIQFVFQAKRRLGDVVRLRGAIGQPGAVMINAPDDVRSLFTAKPEQLSTFSAALVKQVVGSDSILTSTGARFMRQRKLLLPNFHGTAVQQYMEIVTDATERELGTWPLNRPFPLAPRLQAIALDVILAGIFGIRGKPSSGSSEAELRAAIIRMVGALSRPLYLLNGLISRNREDPNRLTRSVLEAVDRPLYRVIEERRTESDRGDILALLVRAKTEQGEVMSDKELRDELISLLLAGHETTANSLAWTWERLVRYPDAYQELRDVVRDDGGDLWVDAAIIEGMRCRPVVPMLGRTVNIPWQFGLYGVPASTQILISALLLHHREDLYPAPFHFRPQRWLDVKPHTYEWIPFGGGFRRCLGSALAMAEQRIILEKMARSLDLEPDDAAPERAVHRIGTMIPARGARVIVRSRHSIS